MRRTALVLGAAAVLATAGVGVATASAAPTTADPGVAHGYYLALNGTADSGAWSPQSDALVDPVIGRCYDLTSMATGPAAWTESVNRTDAVAVLSASPCAALTEAEQRHAPRWTAPGSVSSTFTFRSVRFANLP